MFAPGLFSLQSRRAMLQEFRRVIMMKHFIFLALLYLIGCVAPDRVNFGDYMCPTYQEFRKMQNLSDTSECTRVIKDGKVISYHELTIGVPDSSIGGILPIIIQKTDGTKLEGYMIFPRVEF